VTELHEAILSEYVSLEQKSHPESLARTVLKLGSYAVQMTEVDRVPRLPSGERENNAEHSYMLSLIAPALAYELYPHLDRGLIAQFANVHDLVEIKTGDVPTFAASAEELAQKAIREETAANELAANLDPYTADLLMRYEAQQETEARFVRMVDKLLPLTLDILGPGERVMHEDYDVANPWQLHGNHQKLQERFSSMFPEFPELLAAHELLAQQFELHFTINHASRAMRQSAPKEDHLFRNDHTQPSADK